MVVQAVDWAAIGPVVAVTAALLLVVLAQVLRPGSRRLLDVLALTGLVAAEAGLLLLVGEPVRGTFCDVQGACSYESSRVTLALQAAVLLAAVVCLLLSLDRTGPDLRVEHHALFLAAVIGALVLAGARDLLTMLIGLETASLPLIALVGLRRTAEAAEAAVKLLLVGVVSFGITLLGVALLYTATGTVHLRALAGLADTGTQALPLALGAVLVVCGIAYKVAALPFGLWAPDVFAGSTLPVVAFLSTVSKVAGFAALAMVVTIALPAVPTGWLAVLVAVTMTVGNAVAMRQDGAVRLIAWSTTAHAGWLLLPVAVTGSADVLIGAGTAYLLAYIAATLTVLAVVLLVARHHRRGTGHRIEDYRGLLRTEPVAGTLLLLGLLSLAGLPPGLAGVVAKIAVLEPVLADGVWWLAVVAAVNIALGLVYYLRWARAVFAGPDTDTPTWQVTAGEGAGLTVAAAALVAFTLLPGLIL